MSARELTGPQARCYQRTPREEAALRGEAGRDLRELMQQQSKAISAALAATTRRAQRRRRP